MARDCIICGQRAHSGEHVFPAALGGRRTNKGIYCGKHNNGFSPLAAILAEQLRLINTLLSVRADRSNVPHSFAFDTPSGESYILSANAIALKPPSLKETVVGSSREVTMQFSTQAQADAWIAEQRAAGNDVRITATEKGKKYFSEPLQIQLKLGGREGLRAIGYVALTFFAHHFPTEARQLGMLRFKTFVQGAGEDQFVWWDSPDSFNGLPSTPFKFGHTVALGVSASRSEAYARISLFSALNFAVRLGAVDTPSDRTVIVHINPQAECAPNDISEVRENALVFEVNRPPSLTANLGEMIGSGLAQESIQLLFNRISAWNLDRTIRPVLDELNSIRDLDEDERNKRVKVIVDREGQRVLNLMRYVVDGLKQNFKANAMMAKLVPSLDALVAADETSSTGLSQPASDALGVAKARLAEEIGRHLSSNDLDLDTLSMLLGGGPGAALVGEAMVGLILQRLRDSHKTATEGEYVL
jgi:hypothetical protein